MRAVQASSVRYYMVNAAAIRSQIDGTPSALSQTLLHPVGCAVWWSMSGLFVRQCAIIAMHHHHHARFRVHHFQSHTNLSQFHVKWE